MLAQTEAADAIRDLVETITVCRDPARPGGMAVEIAGRPNAPLGQEAYPNHFLLFGPHCNQPNLSR